MTTEISDLIGKTIETLDAMTDTEWDATMQFFAPSLLAKRPNDLVRILWDRAKFRAGSNDPVRHFQLIMRDLDLAIGPRL